MNPKNLVPLAFVAVAHLAAGQVMVVPVRVAGINPTGASSPYSLTVTGTNAVTPASVPSELMRVMNNAPYFNADFDGTGAELWMVQCT